MNIQRLFIIVLCGLLCACTLTLRPTQDNGLELGSPIGTNSVTGTQIQGVVAGICTVLGIPEVGAVAGGMIVGTIWFWRYLRNERKTKKRAK